MRFTPMLGVMTAIAVVLAAPAAFAQAHGQRPVAQTEAAAPASTAEPAQAPAGGAGDGGGMSKMHGHMGGMGQSGGMMGMMGAGGSGGMMGMMGAGGPGGMQGGMCNHMKHQQGGGMGSGMDAPSLTDHVEGRIAFMRAEIGITETQAPLWAPVADALRAVAKVAQERKAAMAGEHPTAVADMLVRHDAMLTARQQSVRALRDAYAKLNEKLTEEQRANANEVLAPLVHKM